MQGPVDIVRSGRCGGLEGPPRSRRTLGLNRPPPSSTTLLPLAARRYPRGGGGASKIKQRGARRSAPLPIPFTAI